MGFVTAGLGTSGNLVTVGLGLSTVIIVAPKTKLLHTAGTVFHKKRVIAVDDEAKNRVLILESVIEQSESITQILERMKIERSLRIKIIHKIMGHAENTTQFLVIQFKSFGKSTTVIQRKFNELTSKEGKILHNFIKSVEGVIKIDDSKIRQREAQLEIVGLDELIDDIEKAELIDLIKNLEDEDQ